MDIQERAENEVRAGLSNEQPLIDRAKENLDFYRGQFDEYSTRASGSQYDEFRYTRTSLIMQRVVNVLCGHLYARGPRRILPKHPEASAWLEGVYRTNTCNALWHEADKLATAANYAAFRVLGTDNPKSPIEITLWDRSQLCVWCEADSPKTPAVVATIDKYDEQRRLQLWSKDELVTFTTKKWGLKSTGGGGANAWELQKVQPNPYGLVPFSFVHFNFPASEFSTPGIGDYLRNVNDWVNFALTDCGDSVRYANKPIMNLTNVAAGYTMPSPLKPGTVLNLPGSPNAEGGAADPRAEFLQPDMGFVGATWDDARGYLDHTLEMVGVPPGTIRMELNEAKSGISIIVEQIPLILWAQGRQEPFTYYEDDLACLTTRVGATHLGNNAALLRAAEDIDQGEVGELEVQATQLDATTMDPGLVLKWPNMWPDIPGPERDTADGWELDHGLTSRLMLIQKRRNMTRDEALGELKQIAEDRTLEQTLLGPTEPKPALPPGTDPKKAPPNEPAKQKEPATDGQ